MSRGVLLALAGLLFLGAGLLEIALSKRVNPFVPGAEATARGIAVSTAGVYVSLRAVNAVLSTAQEVEVGASVAAQASVQPFKVLEPVDDTVERVADAVFAVAAGAGLAAVGLGPVASLGLVILGLGCLGRAACRGRASPAALAGACGQAMRLGVAFAAVVPLVFWLGAGLGDHLTRAPWQAALADLDRVAGEANLLLGAGTGAEAAPGETAPAPGGAFGRFWQGLASGAEGARDALDAVARYRDAAGVFFREADTLLSASLTIIAVYVLRLLVLPGVILWGALALMRGAVRGA